ncbi:hypothetical protein NKDENANG_03437 [Candidatus Entotheonellaceae bacterium PAL068K]
MHKSVINEVTWQAKHGLKAKQSAFYPKPEVLGFTVRDL